MRKPTYLSPTSMSKWNKDPNDYYLKYLSDVEAPKDIQTRAMAVGSAFDAYVKSFLYEHLFGSPSAPGNDPAFGRDAIFEAQVQKHNWDFARIAGEHCLNSYRYLGALDALMIMLGRSKGKPQFELDIRGPVSHGKNGVVRTVPFRVKPDLLMTNEHGAKVVLDWKVNGYCSMAGVSPSPGFVRGRRSGKLVWTHDDAILATFKNIDISTRGLEETNEEWAAQVAVGAWVGGNPVGSDFVGIIHQLACRPSNDINKPLITIAEHAGFVTPEHQEKIHGAAVAMWEAINSEHVFRHVSLEDSKALCDLLDQRKETLAEGHQILNPALDD